MAHSIGPAAVDRPEEQVKAKGSPVPDRRRAAARAAGWIVSTRASAASPRRTGVRQTDGLPRRSPGSAAQWPGHLNRKLAVRLAQHPFHLGDITGHSKGAIVVERLSQQHRGPGAVTGTVAVEQHPGV
jgi:hypothetical protein